MSHDSCEGNMALVKFKPYSNYVVCGATQSGKSTFMFKLFKHMDSMFECHTPTQVLYCYGIYQPLYDDIKSACPFVTFKEGIPSASDIEKFASQQNHKVIVLDDLLGEVVQNVEMEKLFILGSHHKKLSVFFLQQNLYQQGRYSRTIALNTAYLILFRNIRDSSQILYLSRQISPSNPQALVEAYKDATSIKYGYLVIDCSPHSDDRYRWRTKIWPEEYPLIYQPAV